MKYSVIVPIYNAEETIERCVESLCLASNNRNDIEVLLINDGSVDDSGVKCQQCAKQQKTVKYFEKTNGGVSSARNYGLEKAIGEYCLFVDSDDYVMADYFEKVDILLADYDYDFIVFGVTFYRMGDIARVSSIKASKSKEEEKTLVVVSKMIVNKTISTPCAKVYKRNIIEKNNLRFIENISIAEDWNFNIRYSLNIESICTSNEVNYCVSLDKEESLSRTEVGEIKRQQISFSKKNVEEAIAASQISGKGKEKIYTALEFENISQVYTEAKIDYRKGMSRRERLINTRIRCSEIQKQKIKCPRYLYCWMVALPVKIRVSWFINRFSEYLVNR